MIPKELLKALRKIEITSKRLANEQQLSGSYSSAIKGQGLAFQEVRKYLPGDDVRAIDWNVSARMDETYLKVFTEEREMSVMLVVDVSASGLFSSADQDKRRLATEIAAVCAFSAIAHGDHVGLIAFSDEIEKVVAPGRGRKHGLRVLREILELEPQRRGTSLQTGLDTLARVAKRRSVAFVLSDFIDTGYEKPLARVAAKHDVIPIVLGDRRDRELANTGLTYFEDLETGEDLLIDTGSSKVRKHFSAEAQQRDDVLKKTFLRLGLDSVWADTDRPYFPDLRGLFARRARKAHR
ncbi:MAG: DUF58 domain-containing protein [Polyangiaceae bacterium]|nr:DUF58 domain-containing protein [Polyangiaceae bacterium]